MKGKKSWKRIEKMKRIERKEDPVNGEKRIDGKWEENKIN